MFKMMRCKKGFTLIELIIVIAILAILALIGLPLIGQYMTDSQIAADEASAQVIGRAAEAYLAAHPTAVDGDFTEANLAPYLNANAQAAWDADTDVELNGTGNIRVTGVGDNGGTYPSSSTT